MRSSHPVHAAKAGVTARPLVPTLARYLVGTSRILCLRPYEQWQQYRLSGKEKISHRLCTTTPQAYIESQTYLDIHIIHCIVRRCTSDPAVWEAVYGPIVTPDRLVDTDYGIGKTLLESLGSVRTQGQYGGTTRRMGSLDREVYRANQVRIRGVCSSFHLNRYQSRFQHSGTWPVRVTTYIRCSPTQLQLKLNSEARQVGTQYSVD